MLITQSMSAPEQKHLHQPQQLPSPFALYSGALVQSKPQQVLPPPSPAAAPAAAYVPCPNPNPTFDAAQAAAAREVSQAAQRHPAEPPRPGDLSAGLPSASYAAGRGTAPAAAAHTAPVPMTQGAGAPPVTHQLPQAAAATARIAAPPPFAPDEGSNPRRMYSAPPALPLAGEEHSSGRGSTPTEQRAPYEDDPAFQGVIIGSSDASSGPSAGPAGPSSTSALAALPPPPPHLPALYGFGAAAAAAGGLLEAPAAAAAAAAAATGGAAAPRPPSPDRLIIGYYYHHDLYRGSDELQRNQRPGGAAAVAPGPAWPAWGFGGQQGRGTARGRGGGSSGGAYVEDAAVPLLHGMGAEAAEPAGPIGGGGGGLGGGWGRAAGALPGAGTHLLRHHLQGLRQQYGTGTYGGGGGGGGAESGDGGGALSRWRSELDAPLSQVGAKAGGGGRGEGREGSEGGLMGSYIGRINVIVTVCLPRGLGGACGPGSWPPAPPLLRSVHTRRTFGKLQLTTAHRACLHALCRLAAAACATSSCCCPRRWPPPPPWAPPRWPRRLPCTPAAAAAVTAAILM